MMCLVRIEHHISFHCFKCTFNHLAADAFIQSDLQMITIDAIRPTKE